MRRIFLPRSALLSPAHRLHPARTATGVAWDILDDADYDPSPLTDEEFAAALPTGTAAMTRS